MSTINHDPLAFGGPLTAAAMTAPLGQLDAAIVNLYRLPTIVVRATGGDDLAALDAAVAAADEGTVILLPDPLYQLTDEWHISKSNITVIGRGMGDGSTELRRITNTGGAVIRHGALDTGHTFPLATWPVRDGGLRGLMIQANSLADFALHVRTINAALYEDLWLVNPVVAGLNTDNLDHIGTTSYNDVSSCTFRRIHVYNQASGTFGIRLSGNPQNVSAGVGGQNTYGCFFYDIAVNHGASTTGLQINDVDDIFFFGYSFAGAGTTAIELNGSSGYAHARNCQFIGGYPLTGSKAVIARATGFTKPSRDNLFIGLGNEDTTGAITVEPGAIVHFIDGRGRSTTAPDPRSSDTTVDTFNGGSLADENIGDLGWGFIAAPTRVASSASASGVRRLGTGAVSGTLNALVLPKSTSGILLLPAETFDATFIFALRQTDANTQARVGFVNNYTVDPPTAGIYLEKLVGDTSWFAVCRTGSVETRTTMASTVTAFQVVRLRIRRRNATTISFTIGDVSNENGVEIATNVPTTVLNAAFTIKNSAAADKLVDIDHFMLHIIGMSR